MKLSKILVILLLTNWSFVESQTPIVVGEITDSRDGKIYQTVKIDDITWLTENMRFKTENSDTLVKNDLGIRMNGYYYPVQENDKVCPDGFQIPKISDWEKYVQLLMRLKNIPETSVDYINFTSSKGSGRYMKEPNDTLQFFDPSNPLKLKESGFTQRGKFLAEESMSFWIRRGESTDFKYHLHLESNFFAVHSHKHNNIIAKKKKQRKFVIRCIRNDTVKKVNDEKKKY